MEASRAADDGPSLGSVAWPHPSVFYFGSNHSLPVTFPSLSLLHIYLSQLSNHQILDEGVAPRTILAFSGKEKTEIRKGTCPEEKHLPARYHNRFPVTPSRVRGRHEIDRQCPNLCMVQRLLCQSSHHAPDVLSLKILINTMGMMTGRTR